MSKVEKNNCHALIFGQTNTDTPWTDRCIYNVATSEPTFHCISAVSPMLGLIVLTHIIYTHVACS